MGAIPANVGLSQRLILCVTMSHIHFIASHMLYQSPVLSDKRASNDYDMVPGTQILGLEVLQPSSAVGGAGGRDSASNHGFRELLPLARCMGRHTASEEAAAVVITCCSESVSCDGETGMSLSAEMMTLQWPSPQAECSGCTTQKSVQS